MKITKLDTKIVNIPLVKPYVFAHGVVNTFSNLLVWLRTDEEIFGVGESVSVSGRDISPQSAKVLIDQYVTPLVIGKDPFEVELIHEMMNSRLPGSWIAKAGVDLALWDVMGKALGLPAYKLLGGVYEAQVPVTYTLGMDTPERMAEQAAIRVDQGYGTVVIKIGHEPMKDVKRLKAVREAVGSEVKIRLDANEGYRPDQAIRTIRKMERFEPEFVEEPVKHWDLGGMARVARALDTPISSDESNNTLESVYKVIEMEAADIINLKISKNGGLLNCKKAAVVAMAHGVPCLVGGGLTYEVTRQASRQLATCTPAVQQGYGSEGCGPASQSKVDDVTKVVVTYEDVSRLGGYVVATPGPGLGVELDPQKIQKYSTPSN